jgi:hypothetical protein
MDLPWRTPRINVLTLENAMAPAPIAQVCSDWSLIHRFLIVFLQKRVRVRQGVMQKILLDTG